MDLYLNEAKYLIGMFKKVEIEQISRTKNYRANILSRMTATVDAKMPKSIPVEIKTSPSIEEENEIIRLDIRSS